MALAPLLLPRSPESSPPHHETPERTANCPFPFQYEIHSSMQRMEPCSRSPPSQFRLCRTTGTDGLQWRLSTTAVGSSPSFLPDPGNGYNSFPDLATVAPVPCGVAEFPEMPSPSCKLEGLLVFRDTAETASADSLYLTRPNEGTGCNIAEALRHDQGIRDSGLYNTTGEKNYPPPSTLRTAFISQPAASATSTELLSEPICTPQDKRFLEAQTSLRATGEPVTSSQNARSRIDRSRRTMRRLTTREEANFQCDFEGCGKLFSRSYNFKSHMETHDEKREYPFPCLETGCSKQFVRKTDLQRHHQSVHIKERNYKCDYCGRLFARKDTLRRHMEDGCARRFDIGIADMGIRDYESGTEGRYGGDHNSPPHNLPFPEDSPHSRPPLGTTRASSLLDISRPRNYQYRTV